MAFQPRYRNSLISALPPTLDLQDPRLHITALEARLHLFQLPPEIVLPEELQLPRENEALYSITYAKDEVSILTPTLAESDPVKQLRQDGTLKYEGPWTCLKLAGPMDLTLTGMLCKVCHYTDAENVIGILISMIAPLARGSIPIFSISTWNTDFVLIHDEDRGRAIEALRTAGWSVVDLESVVFFICIARTCPLTPSSV